MAIQVGGTTVVNNSRQLTNVTGADTATKNALAAAGIGGGDEWTLIDTYTNNTTYNEGTSWSSGAIYVTMPSSFSSIRGLAFVVERERIRTVNQYGPGHYIWLGNQTSTNPYSANADRMSYSYYTGGTQPSWHAAVSTLVLPITYQPTAYDANNHSSTGYVRPALQTGSNVIGRANASVLGDYFTTTIGYTSYGQPLPDNKLQPGQTWFYNFYKDSTDGQRNLTSKVWALLG